MKKKLLRDQLKIDFVIISEIAHRRLCNGFLQNRVTLILLSDLNELIKA